MSQTVWDFDPDIDPGEAQPVSGKLYEQERGGLNLGIFADLALQIGHLASNMKREQDRRDRDAASIPADYQNAAGGVYPASGTLVLNLGSPDLGSFWNVRRIIVGGSDITSTPAGAAWVFVQGSPPNQAGANPSIAQVADIVGQSGNAVPTTFPQRSTYATHVLSVDATEYLYVVITGGTAGTQYVASAKLEVYDLSARMNPDA